MFSVQSLSLIVTAGAVAFAVLVGLLRRALPPRRVKIPSAEAAAKDLDQNLGRNDSVFGAYPGLSLSGKR